MQYIEAISSEQAQYPSVFLAGGITDCVDWQAILIDLLMDAPVTIFNPRRANFPIDDPSAAEAQITWEYARLRSADLVSFWFTAGPSPQPIVLFELGSALERCKRLVIGVEDGYRRAQDVYVQTQLRRPELNICASLADLATSICEALSMSRASTLIGTGWFEA